MKNWKLLIYVSIALVLNSCIIKSLQPFYTTESLSYNDTFIGTWTDNKNGQWLIQPAKTIFSDSTTIEKTGEINDANWSIEVSVKDVKKVDKKDDEVQNDPQYQLFSKGYLVSYKKKDKEAFFIAMPFKINAQYFIDFIPFLYEEDAVNDLVNQHLIQTHSVAKVDIDANNKIAFSWLKESKVKDLFESKKLRLKHEKIGLEEDFLLTASSEELYDFLKKYQTADIKDKWKSSNSLQLTKTNANP